MSTVDDYYKELAARPQPNKDKLSNLQTKQDPQDMSPADGGEGYVGSNTGAATGFDYVEGKKGSVESRPIWSEQSSTMNVTDNSGSQDGNEQMAGSDSTDEFASYKRVQSDEGLPQTYRNSEGASDAGPTGSDEPDKNGTFGRLGGKGSSSYKTDLNVKSIPGSEAGDHDMDMPTTEFTHKTGGGAPLFKHRG